MRDEPALDADYMVRESGESAKGRDSPHSPQTPTVSIRRTIKDEVGTSRNKLDEKKD